MSKIFLRALISQHTRLSRSHLTPELGLNLITPECHLWKAGIDNCPFDDPFWAFYWPGGQVLTRYILDNPGLFKSKSVLDVGSGCGSAAIACKSAGASNVVANDTDPVASVAIEMNMEENTTVVNISTINFLATPSCEHFDFVLFGDMFYDQAFGHLISDWIKTFPQKTTVLIGDPGRLQFMSHPLKTHLRCLAKYDLSTTCQLENYGMTSGAVWRYPNVLKDGINMSEVKTNEDDLARNTISVL